VKIPGELKYSSDHEWAQRDAAAARVGITDYAQDALGDIVFVVLPEVGAVVAAGQAIGEVESTKSVSEIYAPVAGTVSQVNETLKDSPELINEDPYGAGWICTIEGVDAASFDALLDATQYGAITNS
jgi:glycine cleavage system H protein